MAEVRRARIEDIPALVEMGRAMHAESPRYQGMTFSAEKLKSIGEHIAGGPMEDALLLVVESDSTLIGLFLAVLAERWFAEGQYVSEMAVYVVPEHRGSSAFVRLVRAAEAWGAERCEDIAAGVSTLIHPESTVRAYERLGYTLTGYTMTKSLRRGN